MINITVYNIILYGACYEPPIEVRFKVAADKVGCATYIKDKLIERLEANYGVTDVINFDYDVEV